MEYTRKELSKRLEKLGVKSQIGKYWCYQYYTRSRGRIWVLSWKDSDDKVNKYIQAYILSDFVGTHKEARENAKKVWGETDYCENCGFEYSYGINPSVSKMHFCDIENPIPRQGKLSWQHHRHQLIDSDDWRKELKLWLK